MFLKTMIYHSALATTTLKSFSVEDDASKFTQKIPTAAELKYTKQLLLLITMRFSLVFAVKR